jgi:hypothetical protein
MITSLFIANWTTFVRQNRAFIRFALRMPPTSRLIVPVDNNNQPALRNYCQTLEKSMHTHIFRSLIRVLAIALTAVGCNGAFAQTPPVLVGATFDQLVEGYSDDGKFVYAASSSAGAITNGYNSRN